MARQLLHGRCERTGLRRGLVGKPVVDHQVISFRALHRTGRASSVRAVTSSHGQRARPLVGEVATVREMRGGHASMSSAAPRLVRYPSATLRKRPPPCSLRGRRIGCLSFHARDRSATGLAAARRCLAQRLARLVDGIDGSTSWPIARPCRFRSAGRGTARGSRLQGVVAQIVSDSASMKAFAWAGRLPSCDSAIACRRTRVA